MQSIGEENIPDSGRPANDITLSEMMPDHVVAKQFAAETQKIERAANDLSLTYISQDPLNMPPLANLIRGNDLPARTVSLLSGLD